MALSSERILTTHVGALQRPPEAEAALLGETGDEELTQAVADVVRRQVDAGIDIVDDGEFGKSIWQWYVTERLGGLTRKEHETISHPGPRPGSVHGLLRIRRGERRTCSSTATDRAFWASIATRPVCVGPITYQPGPLAAGHRQPQGRPRRRRGRGRVHACRCAGERRGRTWATSTTQTQDELLWALADALREEYRLILDAGFQLQVDDAWIPALWNQEPDLDLETYRRFCASRIEALNHALEGFPEDRDPLSPVLGQLARPARDRRSAGRHRRPDARREGRHLLDRGRQRAARARVPPLGDGHASRRARSSPPGSSPTRRT